MFEFVREVPNTRGENPARARRVDKAHRIPREDIGLIMPVTLDDGRTVVGSSCVSQTDGWSVYVVQAVWLSDHWATGTYCSCADFAKWHVCKHLIRVAELAGAPKEVIWS